MNRFYECMLPRGAPRFLQRAVDGLADPRYIDALEETSLRGEEVTMRRPAVILAIGALAVGLTAGIGHAQAPDPIVGTWSLNVSKSKYSPGPAPKSVVLTFEQAAKGMKTTSEVTPAEGQPIKAEFTAPTDGTDVPITGSPIADTVSLKSDGSKRIRVDKKGGKVVMTYEGTISPDGKTFTVNQKGTNEKGQAIQNHLIFEKR